MGPTWAAVPRRVPDQALVRLPDDTLSRTEAWRRDRNKTGKDVAVYGVIGSRIGVEAGRFGRGRVPRSSRAIF
jgi:hypothetical protein